MEWRIVKRPGYFGKKRDEIEGDFNRRYGPGNWRLAYVWGKLVIERGFALQIYEDAYYMHFFFNPDVLAWLIGTASEVYDTAPSNVASGFDYNLQETPNNHIHDISIRRAVARHGFSFMGDHLMEIRGNNSEGKNLSPGVVPFHADSLIYQPPIKGWWRPGSIEDFYQSNKVLQVR